MASALRAGRFEPDAARLRQADRYDSAFVVLAGGLTVLNTTLGAGGGFYKRAGELHDRANGGEGPCEYLVFEFTASDD